jgi:Gp37 protein
VPPVVLDTPWSGSSFTPPTPIDIATVELAIIAQLRSSIDAIEIMHYPDRPESYRLTHRIGAALVRYEGAKYGPLSDTAAIVQERRLVFEITVMMRDLGWNFGGEVGNTSPGAYAMIEAIRATLTGFRIPGCSKMFPLSEKFVERDKQGAVWIYAISFALKTVAVEASSANDFPLFVKGIALEEGGLTSTTVGPTLLTFDSDDQIFLSSSNITQLRISDPATGTEYIAGTDYSVDPVSGTIDRDSGGSIPAGATVNVAYTYSDSINAIATGSEAPTAPTN